MPYLSQTSAPIQEALERMKRARLVPFDVPGHKRGRGNPELAAFLGNACLDVDVNSMKMLDNLCHPVSVIRDAATEMNTWASRLPALERMYVLS